MMRLGLARSDDSERLLDEWAVAVAVSVAGLVSGSLDVWGVNV